MKYDVPPACLEEKAEKDMGEVEQEGTRVTNEKESSVRSQKLQDPQRMLLLWQQRACHTEMLTQFFSHFGHFQQHPGPWK